MPCLSRTAIAAIQYDNSSGKHIRVYYQNPDGDILEKRYDSSGGWKRESIKVGTGKLRTGVAATSWSVSSGDIIEIRLYYLDDSNRIIERCYDEKGGNVGMWYDGGLSFKGYTACDRSKLAAASFSLDANQYINLCVYFQDPSGQLKELLWSRDQWVDGSQELPVTQNGSSLSVSCLPTGNKRWLFYQDRHLDMKELVWSDTERWELNDEAILKGDYAHLGAGMSSAVWHESNDDNAWIRVLTADYLSPFRLLVLEWNGSHVLADVKDLGEKVKSTAHISDVCVINVAGSHQPRRSLRAYYESGQGVISEAVSGDGSTWSMGPNIVA